MGRPRGDVGKLDIIYPDILKAYSKCLHIRLFRNQRHYGEIRNWLGDRKSRVGINILFPSCPGSLREATAASHPSGEESKTGPFIFGKLSLARAANLRQGLKGGGDNKSMVLLAGRSNYNDLHILLASKLTRSTQEKPHVSLRAAGWKTRRQAQKRRGTIKSPLAGD